MALPPGSCSWVGPPSTPPVCPANAVEQSADVAKPHNHFRHWPRLDIPASSPACCCRVPGLPFAGVFAAVAAVLWWRMSTAAPYLPVPSRDSRR